MSPHTTRRGLRCSILPPSHWGRPNCRFIRHVRSYGSRIMFHLRRSAIIIWFFVEYLNRLMHQFPRRENRMRSYTPTTVGRGCVRERSVTERSLLSTADSLHTLTSRPHLESIYYNKLGKVFIYFGLQGIMCCTKDAWCQIDSISKTGRFFRVCQNSGGNNDLRKNLVRSI